MVGGFHLAERRLPLVQVQYTALFIICQVKNFIKKQKQK